MHSRSAGPMPTRHAGKPLHAGQSLLCLLSVYVAHTRPYCGRLFSMTTTAAANENTFVAITGADVCRVWVCGASWLVTVHNTTRYVLLKSHKMYDEITYNAFLSSRRCREDCRKKSFPFGSCPCVSHKFDAVAAVVENVERLHLAHVVTELSHRSNNSHSLVIDIALLLALIDIVCTLCTGFGLFGHDMTCIHMWIDVTSAIRNKCYGNAHLRSIVSWTADDHYLLIYFLLVSNPTVPFVAIDSCDRKWMLLLCVLWSGATTMLNEFLGARIQHSWQM